ncbi:hypothetical protein NHQ30_009983 [Ciborinia camelliae]|nr:hypothetical protein NHQ30_009983 [Ciborinia camelliae]
MRLLKVDTHQLEEFIGTDIPEYAILSHTWGKEEVLFQDLTNAEYKHKKGYTKIEGCCRQAIRDGFDFVWIDTCCIDKSSSAELSESINSMYAWYKQAEVCYAYLVDVPYGQNPYESGSSFRKSRWFTRGWTLQELLAPKKIVFLDEEWNLVFGELMLDELDGESESENESIASIPCSIFVEQRAKAQRLLIEEITGIDHEYLENKHRILWAPAGLKFSWAAMRKTSRPEDIAYCLLGLLRVNMPLLYGEGGNAFQRVQEEVLRKTQDLSILAWGFGMNLQETLDEGSHLTGTLAPSIRYHKNFPRSFHRSQEHFKPTTHSMMTNLGLNISLPLMCINSSLGIYLAFISSWTAGKVGQKTEAFVLPLLKREGQLFEHLSGTPHAISVTLMTGITRRKIKWRTIYLVEPGSKSSSSRRRKMNWINDLDSLLFHQYAHCPSYVRIDHNEMMKAGFVVKSVFSPEFAYRYASNSYTRWQIPSSDFQLILILSRESRGYTDCCVIRIEARKTSRGSVRISKILMARCEPSFSAWQFVNNRRWLSHLTMIEQPSKLKWGSTVIFNSTPGETPEWASFELQKQTWGRIRISINHHTGTEESTPEASPFLPHQSIRAIGSMIKSNYLTGTSRRLEHPSN